MTEPLSLRVVTADITALAVDAIVNAANAELAPGGGVCGAIHRAAGPGLAADCAESRAAHGPLAPGDARATAGHDLPARWVIHALGPVWHGGGQGEEAALARAYGNAIAEARRLGAASIAFPAISTGIFGFPPELAAPIAVRAVRDAVSGGPPLTVVFCCFDEAAARRHEAALTAL